MVKWASTVEQGTWYGLRHLGLDTDRCLAYSARDETHRQARRTADRSVLVDWVRRGSRPCNRGPGSSDAVMSQKLFTKVALFEFSLLLIKQEEDAENDEFDVPISLQHV